QLAVEMTLRQLLPAPTPPPLEPLRPDSAQDPPVELSEELADVGLVVVQAPAAKDRVNLGHQFRDGYRSLAPGTLPDLVLEVLDRLLPGIGANRQRIISSPRCFCRHRITPLMVSGNRQRPRGSMSVSHSAACTASASARGRSGTPSGARVRCPPPAAGTSPDASSPPGTSDSAPRPPRPH